ncbi:T9SS type A sorting domain-containing protein [Flavobacterium lindanitolerans]|jgi:hypothetical protein|uniref:T9SS type A sorting domain-containing protein n=1 Tax=Flavobacterium lindanitolerans TaxID=428988 RepID=UPI0023F4802F|nr:T9SS type A sorting domain-containing protein [Flavobacterium lindanitolerans]
MKTKLSFIAVLIVFSVQSQIISFPDANFKAKLLAASASNSIAQDFSGANFKIDANNNGEIEISEAQQVKDLHILYEPGITSIVGIKNFTNLEYLETAYIHIIDLDVSGMTSLKKLWSIQCRTENINMTGCTSLEDVIFMNIPASTIDFSPLTNLKNLTCIAFNLVSLDLHNNSMLKTLNAGYTNPDNPFVYINIQNGSTETLIDLPCLPPTSLVCCDEADLPLVYVERRYCGSLLFTVSTSCNLGTDNFQKNSSSIYPNPAVDEINIIGFENISKIEIYDINGRCIMRNEYLANNKINVRDLSSGLYIARVYSDEKVSTIKFMKQLQ